MSLTDNQSAALALGSGAARGLAHIGVLNALDSHNIQIKAISGCSIGAVFGGFYAAGKLNEAEKYFSQMSINDVILKFDPVLPSSGLINGKKMMQVFRDIVGDIGVKDTLIPFYPVATHLESGQSVVLSDCKLWEAIRASISIPGLFTPFRINGEDYIDGGITNPLPVNVLKQQNTASEKIIAVNLNLEPSDYERKWIKTKDNSNSFLDKFPKIIELLEEYGIDLKKKNGTPSIIHTLSRTFQTYQYEITWRALELDKPDYLITPHLPDFLFYDFHRSEEALEAGVESVEKLFIEKHS